MGWSSFPISDFRTFETIFHPLITLPTDVRSARFFGGFFSTLVDDDLGFLDVGSGVFDILVLSPGFLASLVRLQVFGF